MPETYPKKRLQKSEKKQVDVQKKQDKKIDISYILSKFVRYIKHATYHYGARQYYPVVPTWDRQDPLCESYTYMSPYNYCLDNLVNAVDPDGRAPFSGAVIGALADIVCRVQKRFVAIRLFKQLT